MDVSTRVQIIEGDPLETLKNCGGYYNCPKYRSSGQRIGPLVGYAAKDQLGKNIVGDTYMNMAMAERYPHVLDHFAGNLAQKIRQKIADEGWTVDWVMGIPEGGRTLGAYIARILGCEFIYPVKKVVALGTDNRRETSEMVMNRHVLEPGTVGVVIEDVCNNFSTTGKIIDLVKQYHANVSGIACVFNRSGKDGFKHDRPYSAMSVADVPTAQYRQGDPYVASDVEKGNVVWSPKAEWPWLQEHMPRSDPASPFGGSGP